MPSDAFVARLNEQIGHEYAAHQQYVACAVYYDAETLPQLARFFYRQALEERDHAMMMVQYLVDADERAVDPRRRRAAGRLRRHRRARGARAVAGEAGDEQINALAGPRPPGGRLLLRAVHAVVHQGADRGGGDDVRPAARRRALAGRPMDIEDYLAREQLGRARRPTPPRRTPPARSELRRRAARGGGRRLGGQLAHPFVRGIGDGSLDEARFRFYVRQDYLFLIALRARADRSAPRARRGRDMRRLRASRTSVLETEMTLHTGFAQRWGVALAELEAERPAPATAGYCDFLLRTAALGDFAELPPRCSRACGPTRRSARASAAGAPDHPGYAAWIATYADPEFRRSPAGRASLRPCGAEAGRRLGTGAHARGLPHVERARARVLESRLAVA